MIEFILRTLLLVGSSDPFHTFTLHVMTKCSFTVSDKCSITIMLSCCMLDHITCLCSFATSDKCSITRMLSWCMSDDIICFTFFASINVVPQFFYRKVDIAFCGNCFVSGILLLWSCDFNQNRKIASI